MQTLLMHLLGRTAHTTDPAHRTATSQRVVAFFHDSHEPCFSLHSICAAGEKYGLVPGRWMGPYALCRTVADIAADRCPDSLHVIVIESGGGAPCIDPDRCVPMNLQRSIHARRTPQAGGLRTTPAPGQHCTLGTLSGIAIASMWLQQALTTLVGLSRHAEQWCLCERLLHIRGRCNPGHGSVVPGHKPAACCTVPMCTCVMP